MSTTLSWLRARTDEQLLALLRARPDLTVPAPSDLGVLSRRLDNPTSVHRALEGLNARSIMLLGAFAAAGRPVSRDDLDGWLGPDADTAGVTAELDRMELLGVIRSDPDGALRLPDAVGQALGPYPAGLGPPTGADPAAVRTALDAQDDAALGILRVLDRSSPQGVCPPDAPAYPTVSALVSAGLLVRIDEVTVELPREVGLALRGDRPIAALPTPPDLPTSGDAERVDSTAAGQALASLHLAGRLVAELGRRPVPALKSGGIGIRELRRLAKELDVPEHRAALMLELLAAGGLITTDEPRSARGATWQPTALADEFAESTDEAAWVHLAQLWLDLRRDPSRAGARSTTTDQPASPHQRAATGHNDVARLTNVLAPELSWTRGPIDRRFVLTALAELPPGAGIGGAAQTEYLAWRAPLRSQQRRNALQASATVEGTWLGVIAFDAITTAGRSLLAGDAAAATAELAAALPPPVDQILLQADLTAVAPGRLTPTLAARMERLADVESSGSATVYRITPASIRRALDAGSSAADLHAVFAEHSATGVPQALEYLIDDTARRHGVLRIGMAASYLRSDDEATLSEAVRAAEAAGFVLRRLAPTVAISGADLPDLLEVLADNGIGVSAEDVGGSVVDVRPRPKRTRPSILTQQRRREPAVPSDPQLAALVERMRSADQADETGDRSQSATESIALLRDAARIRQPVWIGYVDTEGSTTRRLVEPVVVSGGMLVAFDRLRSAMRSFALHRITEVTPDTTIPPTEARPDLRDGRV